MRPAEPPFPGYARAMCNVEIRAAVIADIIGVTEIYTHAVRHGSASFEIDPADETEMARRFNALADAGFPFLVAVIDGGVCGYAYAAPYQNRAAYRHTVEDSIYVAPEFHGRGIGRALLARLLGESAGRGYRQMIAVIGDSQQTASIALHRAAGFRTLGNVEATGYKFGRWLDTVLMQCPLGSGSSTVPF